MIIDLENIGARPKAIEAVFRPDEIKLDVDGAVLGDNVAFEGVTERINGKAHLRGEIRALVTLDCTRCLEPTETAIDESFDSIYVDPTEAPSEAEIILGAEQLDESIADEGRIDIAESVREQIMLALPDHPLCREDCKGLCPKCGGNRNLIDCQCEENEIDPRWAALKNFR